MIFTQTPQPFEEQVDETLGDFYQSVFEHAYELGQEFPEEKNPKMVFDPCNAGDEIRAKAALTAYRAEMMALLNRVEQNLPREVTINSLPQNPIEGDIKDQGRILGQLESWQAIRAILAALKAELNTEEKE